MKISLLISAIILAIAALFFIPRQKEINLLITEWTALEHRANSLNVPTDPRIPFNSNRSRKSTVNAQNVALFADEFLASHRQMKDLREAKDHLAYHAKRTGFVESFATLSPAELRLLIEKISSNASVDNEHRKKLITFAIGMFALEKPEAALAIIMEPQGYFSALREGNWPIMRRVLREYVITDPTLAAQWIVDHQEHIGEIEENSKGMWIRSAAALDFRAALSLIDSLNPKQFTRTYTRLAVGVNSENADAFLAALRADTIKPEQRALALRGLNNSKLMTDFETGTAWLDSANLADTERKAALANVSDYALKDQTAKWLDWIADQDKDKGFIPTYATQSIIERWTMKDFAAVGNWLNSQEVGPRKELAIQAYAQALSAEEPLAAADWAITLPQGRQKEHLLKNILTTLQRKDPEAAASFRQKHNLPTQ